MSTQKPTPAEPAMPNNLQDFAGDHAATTATPTTPPPSETATTSPKKENVLSKKDYDYVKSNDLPKEKSGFADAGLLEPTRYGDWDVKGRCSDF